MQIASFRTRHSEESKEGWFGDDTDTSREIADAMGNTRYRATIFSFGGTIPSFSYDIPECSKGQSPFHAMPYHYISITIGSLIHKERARVGIKLPDTNLGCIYSRVPTGYNWYV